VHYDPSPSLCTGVPNLLLRCFEIPSDIRRFWIALNNAVKPAEASGHASREVRSLRSQLTQRLRHSETGGEHEHEARTIQCTPGQRLFVDSTSEQIMASIR
jgi:hypothetical protein